MGDNELSKTTVQLWLCLLACTLSMAFIWALSNFSFVLSAAFMAFSIFVLLKFFVLEISRVYGVWLSVLAFQFAIFLKSDTDHTVNVPLGVLSLALLLIAFFLKQSTRRFVN